jgi:hypothetical protein
VIEPREPRTCSVFGRRMVAWAVTP